jgi:nitroimidazol reductase NimA-like FMN-containing flavoprotein (pyridoxamine 5'-phosphate oxidase superfamily)
MAKIEEFLTNTRTGVIGISGGAYPYCVPVNYIWKNGVVYFHGLGSGKKTELLAEHPKVSFTVYEEIGTVKDPVPCHADTSYMSVMIFGLVEKVEDYQESAEALQAIVNKFMPGFYQSKITDNKAVAVYKIVPAERTAKENLADEESLFRGKP